MAYIADSSCIPPLDAGRNIPLATSHLGRCTRAPFCEKMPSHSGFCSGPRDRKSSSTGKEDILSKSGSSQGSIQTVQSIPLSSQDVARGIARISSASLRGWQEMLAGSIVAKVCLSLLAPVLSVSLARNAFDTHPTIR